MPAGNPADEGRDRDSRLTLRQRLLLALPSVGAKKDKADKAPLAERLRDAVVKPVGGEAPSKAAAGRKSDRAEDIEAELRSADDNERILGILAAPFAAVIGFIVGNSQIEHASVAVRHELELVMLGLSLVILVMAVLRKRLFLGIVLALYGLTCFDLHLWGFAIPYVLGAAWLLVRTYRLQRELKDALAGAPSRGHAGKGNASGARPRASRRYTPPTPPKRPPPPKPDNEKRAG
jgi:hypothetical protein